MSYNGGTFTGGSMRRSLALAFVACFAATPAFSQNSLTGKWATDRPVGPPAPFERRESAQLELSIDGVTASGTLSLGGLGGTFHVLKDGKVTGKRVQFKVPMGPNAQTTWTIDLADPDTVTIFQSLPDRPLVGNNVLDLISRLGAGNQPGPPSPAAVPVTTPPPGSPISLIGGTVQDSSGAAIPGVTILAFDVDAGQQWTTTTDHQGRYEFPDLKPAKYTLSASLPGFENSTVRDLRIGTVGFRKNFTLEVGGAPVKRSTNANHPESTVVSPVSSPPAERDGKNGTASGIVRGPDGKPAAHIRVAAVTLPETPGDRTGTALSSQTETDEQGRYVLQGIPQGRYMIAAGRVDTPTYHPGTRDMSRATLISVSPGVALAALDFSTADNGDLPLGASSRPSVSPYDPPAGPCVPNTPGCILLHRVK
jgi:hypothetical protein